jgi:hypothetical protein
MTTNERFSASYKRRNALATWIPATKKGDTQISMFGNCMAMWRQISGGKQ